MHALKSMKKIQTIHVMKKKQKKYFWMKQLSKYNGWWS